MYVLVGAYCGLYICAGDCTSVNCASVVWTVHL